MSIFKTFFRSALQVFIKVLFIRMLLLSFSRIGILPTWIWYRLPIETTFHVIFSGGNSFKYCSVVSDSITRVLY